jgi:predicted nucleic acid-binding protein
MSKVFVDTNLIVYTMDEDEPAKRDKCRRLLDDLIARRVGVISTQVLQETYVVATKKLGMDPLRVRTDLKLLSPFEIVLIAPPIIFEAIDCSILNTISFWDSLLVAAASSARCDTLWTEDLNPGQTLLGVRIENPLKDDRPQIHTD